MDFKEVEIVDIAQGPLYELFNLTEERTDELLDTMQGSVIDGLGKIKEVAQTANEAAFLYTYIGTQLSQ